MTGLGFVLGDLERRFREVKLFWVGCSQEVRAIMIAYFNLILKDGGMKHG